MRLILTSNDVLTVSGGSLYANGGKVATLDIHGFTDEECDKFMFQPKVYWNGSSCSDPEPNDWLTDKYTWKYTYTLKEK